MTTTGSLHEMVDRLPEEFLETAARSLEQMREDPVGWALRAAPYDDEPLSAGHAAEIDRRKASAKAGNLVTHEELKRLMRAG